MLRCTVRVLPPLAWAPIGSFARGGLHLVSRAAVVSLATNILGSASALAFSLQAVGDAPSCSCGCRLSLATEQIYLYIYTNVSEVYKVQTYLLHYQTGSKVASLISLRAALSFVRFSVLVPGCISYVP